MVTAMGLLLGLPHKIPWDLPLLYLCMTSGEGGAEICPSGLWRFRPRARGTCGDKYQPLLYQSSWIYVISGIYHQSYAVVCMAIPQCASHGAMGWAGSALREAIASQSEGYVRRIDHLASWTLLGGPIGGPTPKQFPKLFNEFGDLQSPWSWCHGY